MGAGRVRSVGLCVFLLPRLVFESACSGSELPEAEAVLSEACAVFAETEDVGGPDTNMERGGGLTWLAKIAESDIDDGESC